MWKFILIFIGVFVVVKLIKLAMETTESVRTIGGMRVKYDKLLKYILEGHKDSKILVETKTYIRAGVSNYGGNTIFHIQQCPNHTVMIDYEISNNPIIKDFTLRFTFPDDMDQTEMITQMSLDIHKKMMELMRYEE